MRGTRRWTCAGGLVALSVALSACSAVEYEAAVEPLPTSVATLPAAPTTTIANLPRRGPSPARPPTTEPATSAPAPAPTTLPRPTVAQRFATALEGVQVTVYGTAVPTHLRDQVARLWLLTGSDPDPAAVADAARRIAAGELTLVGLAGEMLASPEYAARHAPDRSVDVVAADLFRDVLGRQGTAAEVAGRAAELAAGTPAGVVALGFTDSPEAVGRTGTAAPAAPPAVSVDGVSRGVSDSVLRLYLGLLRRLPSVDELRSGVGRYTAGWPLSAIATELMSTPEYRARRSGGSPEAVVADLYADLLGRAPDEAGRLAWLWQLGRGASPGFVAAEISQSAESVGSTGTAPPETPPLPGSAEAPFPLRSGACVFSNGDSDMLGSADALRAALPGITVDAEVSRQFSEGVAIIELLAAAGQLPGTVVVHLGTNGSIGAQRCDQLMSAAAGRQVVLLTLEVPRSWEAPNNGALRECAARHGAAIADWNAVAEPQLLAGDGFHVRGDGARRYASLVAATL